MWHPFHCALAMGLAAIGCAGSTPCTGSVACGGTTWRDAQGAVDSRMALAPAVDAAGPGATVESLAVTRHPLFVHFDLAPLAEAGRVDRAVLALAPSTAWRPPGTEQRLVVRPVVGPWTVGTVAQGMSPAMDGGPAGEVTLNARVRGPVRIDVTAMVRSWMAGALPAEGLALESTGTGVVFQGAGTSRLEDRPRLEVVYQ